MSDHNQIARNYFNKLPFKKGLGSKVGWNHYRFWHDDTQIFSYQMPLATRIQHGAKDFYIINGDGAPTITTSKHQGIMRGALSKVPTNQWAIIPYGALDRASIRVEDVQLIATTPDRYEQVWRPCRSARCNLSELDLDLRKDSTDTLWSEDRSAHSHVRNLHYLGETYFRTQRRGEWEHYVCGLDRNDDPRRRMFFLAQLPKLKVWPLTVDGALDALRPAHVHSDTPRQGEWFFMPVTFKYLSKISEEEVRAFLEIPKRTKVEVVSEKSKRAVVHPATEDESKLSHWERQNALRRRTDEAWHASLDARSSEKRHWVPEIIHVRFERGKKPVHEMFVRGAVRDDEHDTLQLPKGWHHVVKNLALRGWRTGGNGTKVD